MYKLVSLLQCKFPDPKFAVIPERPQNTPFYLAQIHIIFCMFNKASGKMQ